MIDILGLQRLREGKKGPIERKKFMASPETVEGPEWSWGPAGRAPRPCSFQMLSRAAGPAAAEEVVGVSEEWPSWASALT